MACAAWGRKRAAVPGSEVQPRACSPTPSLTQRLAGVRDANASLALLHGLGVVGDGVVIRGRQHGAVGSSAASRAVVRVRDCAGRNVSADVERILVPVLVFLLVMRVVRAVAASRDRATNGGNGRQSRAGASRWPGLQGLRPGHEGHPLDPQTTTASAVSRVGTGFRHGEGGDVVCCACLLRAQQRGVVPGPLAPAVGGNRRPAEGKQEGSKAGGGGRGGTGDGTGESLERAWRDPWLKAVWAGLSRGAGQRGAPCGELGAGRSHMLALATATRAARATATVLIAASEAIR